MRAGGFDGEANPAAGPDPGAGIDAGHAVGGAGRENARFRGLVRRRSTGPESRGPGPESRSTGPESRSTGPRNRNAAGSGTSSTGSRNDEIFRPDADDDLAIGVPGALDGRS